MILEILVLNVKFLFVVLIMVFILVFSIDLLYILIFIELIWILYFFRLFVIFEEFEEDKVEFGIFLYIEEFDVGWLYDFFVMLKFVLVFFIFFFLNLVYIA